MKGRVKVVVIPGVCAKSLIESTGNSGGSISKRFDIFNMITAISFWKSLFNDLLHSLS